MSINLEKTDKIVLNNSGSKNKGAGKKVIYLAFIASLFLNGGCSFWKENKAPEVKEPGIIAELEEQPSNPTEKGIIEEPIVENKEPGESNKEVPEEPTIEEPAGEEPIEEEPTIEEPAGEEPIEEKPTIEEPVVEGPIIEEPVAPEVLLEPTNPDISVPFMSEQEIEKIIDHIISQLAGDKVAYRNPSPNTIHNLIYLLNGKRIDEKIETEYAINYLAVMIKTTTGYEAINRYIDGTALYMKRVVISIEDMIDKINNKDSYEYLVKYFNSKQAIYKALEEKKNPGAICLELVKFTDELHRVFAGETKLFGEVSFEDLSLEVQMIILFDFENMNGNINYANDYGILDKYNIKPQYDFNTKYQQYAPIKKMTLEALRERANRKNISSLIDNLLLARSIHKGKDQPINHAMKKYGSLPI